MWAFGCVSEMLIELRCFLLHSGKGLWFSLILSVISPSQLSPHFIIICLPAKISSLVGRQTSRNHCSARCHSKYFRLNQIQLFDFFFFYHFLRGQICCSFYDQNLVAFSPRHLINFQEKNQFVPFFSPP